VLSPREIVGSVRRVCMVTGVAPATDCNARRKLRQHVMRLMDGGLPLGRFPDIPHSL
jgi:hypothetical protein